ncbi:MucR family transcriptional regulator [Phenylobacterium sp. LH3H17]|uniref:MucR family transcriptional regulator n=1 Tax=Phenylobacterium sp. LH3H17 TaxID=2903901 RepID=UPI0020C97FB1|nr:MucR family transcriptional regulator [Phenylobacterium sp. LH3H17]UTP38258.1 MucR family transcriptional regulator [Phenylobacterium sp. LH3H17]
MADDDNNLRELVADVAAAYFSNTHVVAADIPNVISQIAASLQAVRAGVEPSREAAGAPVEAQPKLTPAQIRKSITPEALLSFEDGRGYKTLRRHLSVKGLTPEQYREKWGLPRDYPMVSPSYSAARSQMAKSIGLGRKVAPAAKRGRAKA